MFDFAWSELGLIAVVALILIGPKDLPVAIRAITDMIKKARRMAGEFQTHVDEMVREANLDEVRNQISDIRNFDFKGEVEKAVDPDGSLRSTFASNPLQPDPPKPIVTPAPDGSLAGAELTDGQLADIGVGEHAVLDMPRPEEADRLDQAATGVEERTVPAFVPPSVARPPERPSFVPPGTPSPRPRV